MQKTIETTEDIFNLSDTSVIFKKPQHWQTPNGVEIKAPAISKVLTHRYSARFLNPKALLIQIWMHVKL